MAMEKEKTAKVSVVQERPHPRTRTTRPSFITIAAGLIVAAELLGVVQDLADFSLYPPRRWSGFGSIAHDFHNNNNYDRITGAGGAKCSGSGAPYGQFPQPGDPFSFLPCTNATLPPALDDPNPARSWAKLYDADPAHWSWTNKTEDADGDVDHDPYAGRGIYLCGYLDVPLDYTNASDKRIARLAVTKLQVSGLARVAAHGSSSSSSSSPSSSTRAPPGSKSARTIVIEPGGPGGSGTSYAWRGAASITARLSDGRFDVLGWDPRGVNASRPAASCFPYDADRDRWALLTGQYRESAASAGTGGPRAQLAVADAMNNATLAACARRLGDLGRFVGTAFVARDMERIREALGEDELTGYLVSYGTGIGQTYANMFPDSVGRLILDGTEYVRDHRLLGGFGWTALDNATDAWRDGFLGECLGAGPRHCALARPPLYDSDGTNTNLTVATLDARMRKLISSAIEQPVPGYTASSGPSLVTYSALVGAIYGALYNAQSWPALAQMLYELEAGNSTLATAFLESRAWEYDPTLPLGSSCPSSSSTLPPPPRKPSTDELSPLVICADSYDAPQPPGADGGLAWWDELWANMTAKSWVSGNSRLFNVLPCRHFTTYWPNPAEVYRGDLNTTLRHPVLLIAETYDPATPLRNGRRLAREMGYGNARLVAHHGYGHSSRDASNCTDNIAKSFILEGTLPDEPETSCYANEKPYRYGVGVEAEEDETAVAASGGAGPYQAPMDPVTAWQEHLEVLAHLNPRLLRPW